MYLHVGGAAEEDQVNYRYNLKVQGALAWFLTPEG